MPPRGVASTKEPSTAVATMPSRQASFPLFMERYDSMVNLCTMLAKSGKIGQVRSPESALAIALQAAELGIPPMTGFNNLYQTPGGKIGMSASLMHALVIRDVPGAKFVFEEKPDRCTITVTRPGMDPYVSSFSLEDAKKAGLVKKDSGWEKYPGNMMRSRALANACRVVAPEVLAGMYAPEELDDAGPFNVPPTIATVVSDSATAEISTDQESGVIDVEPVKAETNVAHADTNGTNKKHAEPSKPEPTNAGQTGPKAATPQLLELKRLMEQLNLKDSRWKDTLAPFGVTTARDLTSDQANHLISVLRKRETVAAGN